ncbi:6-phospho-beta-glucosidase [Amycolatopsis nigrescens]|uniref:6-phospho-beta-glucosidase n=1 Tax=Amycolatopsis nigrescens TaxID=381445 RepID=UPI000477993C|nr:6-phospho-beta-glucosidase [Amycolatopsis nigrescens]
MRLVLLGGGGFRVPLVHAGLLADPDRLVDELVLYDVSESRMHAIAAVLEAQAAGASRRPRLRLTTDLDDALTGADVVFSAIRAGGLRGRELDERIALKHGVLGQETVGAGGICYALRTIPVAMRIAERVAALAPDSWLINFTNPAGVVTAAMSAVLGDRVIGICDSPVGLCRRVAGALGVPMAKARFDYAGLNHLGWLRAVLVDGHDRLPGLLADEDALAGFEEGRLFGARWLRALGAVPNEYLHYYYFTREVLAQSLAQPDTRGQFLHRQQAGFFERVAGDPGEALGLWQATRAEREQTYLAEGRAVAGSGERADEDLAGGGYEEVALSLTAALAGVRDANLILNVRNRGAVPELGRDTVVETHCQVDGNGPRPLAANPLDPHCLALTRQVAAVERSTVLAATTASREQALLALACHPLVDSVTCAAALLEDYLSAFPELGYLR